MRWESHGLVFAVYQHPIDFHVKNAALTFHKDSIHTPRVSNRGRQTGGLRRVVSHHAIRNFNLHWQLSSKLPQSD